MIYSFQIPTSFIPSLHSFHMTKIRLFRFSWMACVLLLVLPLVFSPTKVVEPKAVAAATLLFQVYYNIWRYWWWWWCTTFVRRRLDLGLSAAHTDTLFHSSQTRVKVDNGGKIKERLIPCSTRERRVTKISSQLKLWDRQIGRRSDDDGGGNNNNVVSSFTTSDPDSFLLCVLLAHKLQLLGFELKSLPSLLLVRRL